MKVVISSDRCTVVNFENVHTIKVDAIQNGNYYILIDAIIFATCNTIKDAKKQVQDLLNAMKSDNINQNVIFRMEDIS